jgi:two-component system, OmpR family, copper resistance phosphate regulon response regulator CusR
MKALIVEDEEKLAQTLKTGLEREGIVADYVTDGLNAEKRIFMYNSDYDVIILDLMLPGKDGFEIAKEIREHDITTPILILTARNSVEDKTQLLSSGADDYVVKPFSFEELKARIKAVARRPARPATPTLQVKNLTLDPSTRKVTRNGKEIHLTLKEFNMLEYLMQRPNQAVNREEMFSSLWDFNSDSFSNVVDVHLKNLRKKIDDPFNEKLLETVHGVGYKIRG